MADRRFPGKVYRRGSEPDARFSLANERTFLTWVTTGLALLSVGVALDELVPGLNDGLRFRQELGYNLEDGVAGVMKLLSDQSKGKGLARQGM